MFNPFSWLYKERKDLQEPKLPEVRFYVEAFTLVCVDKSVLKKLGNPKEGHDIKGLYFPKTKEMYTSYTIVKDNIVPDMYNVGHELCHHIMGDSGDFIDGIKRNV